MQIYYHTFASRTPSGNSFWLLMPWRIAENTQRPWVPQSSESTSADAEMKPKVLFALVKAEAAKYVELRSVCNNHWICDQLNKQSSSSQRGGWWERSAKADRHHHTIGKGRIRDHLFNTPIKRRAWYAEMLAFEINERGMSFFITLSIFFTHVLNLVVCPGNPTQNSSLLFLLYQQSLRESPAIVRVWSDWWGSLLKWLKRAGGTQEEPLKVLMRITLTQEKNHMSCLSVIQNLSC